MVNLKICTLNLFFTGVMPSLLCHLESYVKEINSLDIVFASFIYITSQESQRLQHVKIYCEEEDCILLIDVPKCCVQRNHRRQASNAIFGRSWDFVPTRRTRVFHIHNPTCGQYLPQHNLPFLYDITVHKCEETHETMICLEWRKMQQKHFLTITFIIDCC